MVAITLFAKVKTVLGAAAALASLTFANPVLANSSAAVADVAAPLRAAQAAKPAPAGDEEFRRLFSSWKSIEGGNAALALNTAAAVNTSDTPVASLSAVLRPNTVSIPSLMPVAGAKLTSGYGGHPPPGRAGRPPQRGTARPAPPAPRSRPTADGVVGRADWFSSYGLFVSLEHGGSIETRYGHMSRLNVAAGQAVKKGDIIGYVGSTGRSTGPHLHYEVRIAGVAVNPLPYMQGDVADSSEVALGGSK